MLLTKMLEHHSLQYCAYISYIALLHGNIEIDRKYDASPLTVCR